MGNQVNVLNLEYTFTEGGKYILTFRDIYGRQEIYEIFYLKGLPQAELVGVKVGGTTKDDVSCIYDDVETAILYKETESGWVVVNDVYTYDTGNNTRTTTITATSGEYTTYKFLVYVTADRNLFSEYKFKIKKRLPTVTVKDVYGNDVELNGITNKQFTIDWDDRDVHVDYSRSANKFNTTRYYRGEIFGTRVGTYYFDVSDSVGNTTSFSITFDNAVDYTIKGNYKLINGEIWSRRPITINPGEELTLYSCVSDSGESQQMGAALEIDGRYTIDIADVAGNVVNLVVVIDTTAPSPTVTKIDGTEAAINKSINTAFTVAFNEECTVKYSNNLESNVAYTGQELNVVGKYTFIATDLLGNTMTFTVTIDNEVLFKVDGTYVVVNGVYKSRFLAAID